MRRLSPRAHRLQSHVRLGRVTVVTTSRLDVISPWVRSFLVANSTLQSIRPSCKVSVGIIRFLLHRYDGPLAHEVAYAACFLNRRPRSGREIHTTPRCSTAFSAGFLTYHPYAEVTKAFLSYLQSNSISCLPDRAAMTIPVAGAVHWPTM